MSSSSDPNDTADYTLNLFNKDPDLHSDSGNMDKADLELPVSLLYNMYCTHQHCSVITSSSPSTTQEPICERAFKQPVPFPFLDNNAIPAFVIYPHLQPKHV